MFERAKLKKEIKTTMQQIQDLENRRIRSQAALVQAILEHKDPNDTDVEFFNKYTEQINTAREQLHRLQTELETKS